MNGSKEKIVAFFIGSLLIIGILSVFAVFSGAVMGLLGFEYETPGAFVLYFIIASIVSYPVNLVAGALSKALLYQNKISKKIAVLFYVLLDAAATFLGFFIVDYFMCSVSASIVSLVVISLVFTLFGIGDIGDKRE